MKPIYLLDVDGVLCNFLELWCRCANKRYQLQADWKTITPWEGPYIGEEFGLSKEEDAQVWRDLKQPGVIYDADPIEGAPAFVRQLSNLGDVYFVTAKIDEGAWMSDRVRWVKDHVRFDVRAEARSEENVIFATAHTKKLVYGNMFIDDKPGTVQAWTAFWKERAAPYTPLYGYQPNGTPPWDALLKIAEEVKALTDGRR